MNRIQLEIEALSPLAIGRHKPGGSISEAQDYIPGSVIRGAFASVLLQSNQNPEPNDDFHALFLNENSAIFQNAYPANPPKNHTKIDTVLVLPATVLSSKAKPGFKDKGNGVFDTLIDQFCAEDYGQLYDPNCPKDYDRVDNFSGFYCKIYDKYHPLSANKRLLTRVGINRKRATAEESILYSIEVLNESQPKKEKPSIYRGAILVPDGELAEKLRDFINKHSELFRLGGSTSRGLGKVKIQAELRENIASVEDRIQQFNDNIKERWQLWGSLFGPASGKYSQERTYFTLDLQSDAILTENWRRTTVISEAMLKEFATDDDSSFQLEVAYSSYDYYSGWNAAWGLMKEVELVTNKGGVYLFSTTQPDLWFTALKTLESKGVGERTNEGFGQIQICNEFHLEFREKAV
ncbi:CRISPR-associated RAMP protein Csx10 [Limnoraphis robusta]|uniref:CRISPR-associated RAMP protein Csx10 n=1 Tax=Limnoraphis robusta CCNP1315 TaxID=3110306 RepID=A0ABU5TT28_9CYAN|nr:CRISPR-associated RAMP protein Csx10 [Limnoraphis robusta]MEA5518036.1 CRISPR-associated RAMP protein Csx10 [Limnoraphis robusta CCNP1315]MEA5547819.1 CRISPR-associated RAMP protein Csx10 [Limnoraphis robusta CCNP1324]